MCDNTCEFISLFILIVFILFVYFVIRNYFVEYFLEKLIAKCWKKIKTSKEFNRYMIYDYYTLAGAINFSEEKYTDDQIRVLHIIFHKCTYLKLLLSFKPLSEKYWLTEEERDFLNS